MNERRLQIREEAIAKLIERIIVGSVAFTVWAVSFVINVTRKSCC
jgi:hypothetical protein